MNRTALLLFLFSCVAFGASTDLDHPQPQDPNHVHGKEDNGIGNGGHDQGVADTLKVPSKVSVLPAAEAPAFEHGGGFSNWDAISVPGNVPRNGGDGWYTTEAGNVKHASERYPYVQPWSRLDIDTPVAAKAIVLSNGWPNDDKSIEMTGTVTINEGQPIAVSGWKADMVLVVPVPQGVLVKSVTYKATTIPGADASGVHKIWVWE